MTGARAAGVASLGTCVVGGWLVASAAPSTVPGVLSVLLLAALAAVAAATWHRGTFDLFSPLTIVLGLIAAQFPLQAIYEVWLGRSRAGMLSDGRWVYLLNVALGLSLLASLAFAAGYLLAGAAPASGDEPADAWTHGRWDSSRVRLVVVLLSLVGVAAYAKFMQDAGGILFFVRNLQARVELATGRHDLLAGVQLLPIASIIWYAHSLREGVSSRERLLMNTHGVVASAMLFTLGGRSTLVSFWVALMVVRHYGRRRFGVRFTAVFACVAVAFIAIAGWYRASTAASVNAPTFAPGKVFSPRAVADEVLNYDVSPLDVFVIELDKVPSQIGYRMGGTLADTIYQPIPRSLLPSKPPVLTAWYKQYLLQASDGGGVRASALGEGYVDFGVIGVVVLLAAYGAIARGFVGIRRRSAGDEFGLVLYAVAVEFLVQVTIGSFDESAVAFAERVIPLLLVARLLAAPRRLVGEHGAPWKQLARPEM